MEFNIKSLDDSDPIFQYITKKQKSQFQNVEALEDDSLQNQGLYIKMLNRTKGTILGKQSNNTTFHIAKLGWMYGLTQDKIFELMLEYWNEKCQPPWPSEKLLKVISNACEYGEVPQGCLNIWRAFEEIPAEKYADELEKEEVKWCKRRNKGKGNDLSAETWNARAEFYEKLSPIDDNGKTIFVPNPLYRILRFNRFANKISFTRQAPWHEDPQEYWIDSDTIECRKYLDQRRGIGFSKTVMEDAAEQVARTYDFHPIREWIKSLHWDGEPRLNRLLIDYAGARDTPYVREIGKNVLIAAVARVFLPGCKHDSMLVLEGKENTGKTSFVQILGGKWYGDVRLDFNKLADTIQTMQECWIIEASELEFMKRSEVQAVKRFLTLKEDKARFAFGHYSGTYPRQSIFIGTVNPGADPTYLSDTEGNRRYWPVATTKIDLPGLLQDRNQLFAEAYTRFSKGEKWHIDDPALIKTANSEVNARVGRDSWQEIIAAWLASDDLPDLTGKNIAQFALDLRAKEYDRLASIRVTKCMRNLGFDRKKLRIDKHDYQHIWTKEDDLEGL